MKKLTNKGFTLVELLVVIIVLAIVTVIAMQSITGIVNNNRVDSFLASLDTVKESAELSCAQSGDISLTDQYVKQGAVKVKVDEKNGTITMTAQPGSKFAEIKTTHGNILTDRAEKKGYDEKDCGFTPDDEKLATCTIEYKCE